MNKYKVIWLDGSSEVLTGDNVADAFNRAGYGGGAISAVDYFRQVENQDPNKTYYIYGGGIPCRLAVCSEDIEPYLHEHASEEITIEERDLETGITTYGWLLEPFMPVPEFFEIR